jgi:hypothetical protein
MDGGEEVGTVHLGHLVVREDYRVGAIISDPLQRGFRGGHRINGELFAKQPPQPVQDVGLVIDDQHSGQWLRHVSHQQIPRGR